jgi:hypothetical protein
LSTSSSLPRPASIPVVANFDPTTPSIARVYDYLLNGEDNFAADREVAQRLMAVAPLAAKAMCQRPARTSGTAPTRPWGPLTFFREGGAAIPPQPEGRGLHAAPVSFAAIALAWYALVTSRILTGPPATVLGVTTAWYAIAAAALALTCVAMRDRWHRYSRHRG